MSLCRRKVVLAPDSFKGSLSASAAADAMEAGVRRVRPDLETEKLPLSDGGEGMLEVIVSAKGGRFVYREVTGPLGDSVEAAFGLIDDGATAVVEAAAACGLTLVEPSRRDPLRATSRGVGELVKYALDEGVERIVVGIGGSAVNDAGAGMAQALGVRFLDAFGNEIPTGGAGLLRLERIDVSGLDPRLENVDVVAACDVTNPLLGPEGASRVYAPQKGADREGVELWEKALARFAEVAARCTGVDVRDVPGAGAAGGMGAALVLFLGARIQRGIEMVMDAVSFTDRLGDAVCVITGEGRVDGQSIYGKVLAGVARRASACGVPVAAVAGQVGEGLENVCAMGIDVVIPLVGDGVDVEYAMKHASSLLGEAAGIAVRLLVGCGAVTA